MAEEVNPRCIGGTVVNPGQVTLPQNTWSNAGSITATEAKLAVDELTSTYIDALGSTKTALLTPSEGCNNIEFRFRTDGSENDAPVLHVYAARGASDHYLLVGDLTLTQGTQAHTGTSIYFVDASTPANEDTFFAAVEYNTTDRIGRYHLNTQGYTRFVFICSNLSNVTTVYVDYAEC